jgi:hypothetical protein
MKYALSAIFVILLFGATSPLRAADSASADAALNANYKALLSQLPAEGQQGLRDAQRAWIAFRDKECGFRAQGRADAALAKSVRAACVGELTQRRADDLERALDCPSDDATCLPRAKVVASTSASAATCSAAVGAAKAEEYVRQCQQVSPATHPPCNVANPCELITDEIKRGCALIGKDAPAFCGEYAKP